MAAGRFVLLDRDGTLIVEKNYLADPAGVELIPGAREALLRLRDGGWATAVISNQSGVGRGYFTREDVERVHARVLELLGPAAGAIAGFYYCPHAPEDRCGCRKPATGLVVRAAAELGFDPEQAWVVGDKAADVELGRNCGARTVLVRTGYGSAAEAGGVLPDYVAEDLPAAAEIILSSASATPR